MKVKHYDTTADYIKRQVDGSLTACQVECFDVLLLHRPDPLMNGDEVAAAMYELKKAGKVKYFGVSNFTVSQMELLESRLKKHQLHIVTN